MTRKILLVVHQDTSDSGRIGRQLADRGFRLDIRCPLKGDGLPPGLDGHAGVVMFGGPQSANEDDRLPGLRKELDWLPTVLEAEKPFLGICLGAQLLARVLGAKVDFHPEGLHEIGYHPVTPTAAWHHQFERTTHFYEWHKETFELPAGATLLAEGAIFANQAFRYGERVYGIQFHPEVTRRIMLRWTHKASHGLQRPEAQPRQAQIEHDQRLAPVVEDWTRRFLDHWIGHPPRRRGAAAATRVLATPPGG